MQVPTASRPHGSPPLPPAVINKYKRRRFQKTKNLLTGETEADPEMIKVTEWGCGRRRDQLGGSPSAGSPRGSRHP